ncbi:hypothetical protein M2D63_016485 [Pseudomonas sp. BJa5]|uniref:hypothetical protein n=1 Tax=Pseudomonas sp. BJa5 TaxID=2936270 RepID=UPI00255A300D|nr:hypothetical protein [Pseudomonas sp. BGr12]MDL2422715.1 hypothetical protein [Pseudomonas sp. BGr12]
MDGFYILYYLQGSLRRGDVPYLTDIDNIILLGYSHSDFAMVMGAMGLIAHFSVIVTCVLFAVGWRVGCYLAMVQIPFRVVFLIPSISTLLLWPRWITDYVPWFMLVVGSEIVKVWSLWWLSRVKGRKRGGVSASRP